jgi:hypothetical protein
MSLTFQTKGQQALEHGGTFGAGVRFRSFPSYLLLGICVLKDRSLLPYELVDGRGRPLSGTNHVIHALSPKFRSSSPRNFFGSGSIPEEFYHLHRLDPCFSSFHFCFARISIGVVVAVLNRPRFMPQPILASITFIQIRRHAHASCPSSACFAVHSTSSR